MGQLKTSLINLQKLLINNPGKLEHLEKALDEEAERIEGLARTAGQGWDAMVVYLSAKFKKAGTTIDAQKAKKVKEVLDSELAGMIKGMDQWRKDLIQHSNKASTVCAAGVKEIKANVDLASAESKKLRGICDKKKAKWLASAKYKAKIKDYLTMIDQIDKMIALQEGELAKAGTIRFDEAWINKWHTVKADMTVGQIHDMASMDTQNILKDYHKNMQVADGYVRKLRDEYKGMAGQIASMKKWVDTADDMESVT